MGPATKPFKVYQASAGSGKTYTIVKEYLERCLQDEASTSNFSHILAITFTNMAANEMKDKIVRHLNDIIHSDPDKPAEGMEKDLIDDLQIDRATLKKNAEILFYKILHDYSNFNVCTIDTFVQKLARPFAKELQLPNRFTVSIDDTEIADAITERIGEQIGEANPFLTKILEDFNGQKLDNEKSPKIEQNIHDFIVQLFSEEAYQKNEQNQFTEPDQYQETVAFLKSKTSGFEQRCRQFNEEFGAFCDNNQLRADDFKGKSRNACFSLWNKVKDKQLAAPTSSMLKLLDDHTAWYANTLPKERGRDMERLQQEFEQCFISFLEYYSTHYGAYQFYRKQYNLLNLYVLRSIIRAETEAFIGDQQLVHISEFNKRIHNIMGDFSVPFIYERIGEHYKHLFIDEFQDTSLLQWQNLIPLLDNNLADRNMNMVVGDGKQSIYRWRNGEVGQIVSLPRIFSKPADSPAFDDFERTLINNFNFNELRYNFRSFKNIVAFNNAFFAFSTAEPYLDEQTRKVYLDHDETTGKSVSIEQKGIHEEEGLVQVELFDPDEMDDTTIPERILGLIKELMACGFQKRDITVLVRENKQGSLVANYLTENHIEVVSNDSILLKSSDKVQLIVKTLDYLSHSDNPGAIASVLYYWHASHQEGFNGVMNGFFDRAKAIAKGEDGIEEEMGLPVGTLQSLLAKAYSLYDLCSALARTYGFNTVGDTYLNFLLDNVFNWQSSNQSSIEAFLTYWEKKGDKLSVVTGNADAVTIMTIHKSKGLEFPVVIYPYAVDNLDNKRGSTIWIETEKLGFEPIPHIEKVQFSISNDSSTWTEQTSAIFDQEKMKIRLDNMNINYVAFTRPTQRLYILTKKANDEGKSPINGFVAEHQDHQVESTESYISTYRWGDPNMKKVVQKKPVASNNTVFHDSRSSDWFQKISIDPDPSMFWISKEDRMKPREWGDFVHQVLSEIHSQDDIDRKLKPYKDAGVIDDKTATMLRDLFTQMVHHPVISPAFLPEAKIKNECEILSKDYGILRPDRYAELQDRIYLLDYKTGKPEKEHHRQLRQYVTVLKKMVSKTIEAYLVYLGDSIDIVPIENLTINSI